MDDMMPFLRLLVTQPAPPHQLRRSSAFSIGLLLVGFGMLASPSVCPAIEPNFGYYDDVPPIDKGEIDAVAERTIESRKRLRREGLAKAEKADQPAPTVPFPPAIRDERDDVPGIDFKEVEELRNAFQEMRSTAPAGTSAAPSSGKPLTQEPSAGPSEGTPHEDLEGEMKSLTERMNALERVLVGTEERPGLSGLIGGWTRQNGFFLMSSGGDFFLRLPALLQFDLRTFPSGQNGADPGVRPNTFILQRVRPMVHFRLWRHFRGLLAPDLGNGFTSSPLVQGRVQTPDAFLEWDYYSTFRIRAGKFKSPIGLEILQGAQNLTFMERSLVRNLLPNRDEGAMVWGVLQHGLLEYQVGAFNGVPNANFYRESAATSSGKTMEARVFARPFMNSSFEALQGLGLGAGMSVGSVRNNNGQDPMQTETFSYTFFDYRPQVTGDGDRTRFAPQMAWYYKRAGLMGQYVVSTQHLRRTDTGTSARTTHDAWSAQVSFMLTDDTATFGRVEPRTPVSSTPGHWGAWELAIRYAQVNLDPDSFAFQFADPATSVLRAKTTTIGLNWYLNSSIRLTGNFAHTDFTGATSAYRAANHEDGLMFRTQLVF